MARPQPYPPEFREEAVRYAKESSKSLNAVARELGIARESLRKWMFQSDVEAGVREGLTSEERRELFAAASAGADLGGGEGDPVEGSGFLRPGDRSATAMSFRLVEAEKAQHRVSRLCRALGVSRAGYYRWSAYALSA